MPPKHRDTDTGKWGDRFFRALSPKMKCFYSYFCDECDNAGVWKVDLDLAAFSIGGERQESSPADFVFTALPPDFQNRVFPFHDGEYWYNTKFLRFHYGEMKREDRMFRHVSRLLEIHGIGALIALPSPFDRPYEPLPARARSSAEQSTEDPQDVEPTAPSTLTAQSLQHAGREAGIGNNGGKAPKVKVLYLDGFEEFWAAYPKRKGKGKAAEEWSKARPDASLLAVILAAVEAQRSSRDWTKEGGQFIPMPSTWLHQKRWGDDAEVSVGKDIAGEGSDEPDVYQIPDGYPVPE